MDSAESTPKAVIIGIALGALTALLALLLAAMSAGAGHGGYVAARALFPFSMALTLVEGSIGLLSFTVALAQFPIYGGVWGWSKTRNNFRPLAVFAFLHLIAVIFCFSGTLPAFS
jgi:hypothetical protein